MSSSRQLRAPPPYYGENSVNDDEDAFEQWLDGNRSTTWEEINHVDNDESDVFGIDQVSAEKEKIEFRNLWKDMSEQQLLSAGTTLADFTEPQFLSSREKNRVGRGAAAVKARRDRSAWSEYDSDDSNGPSTSTKKPKIYRTIPAPRNTPPAWMGEFRYSHKSSHKCPAMSSTISEEFPTQPTNTFTSSGLHSPPPRFQGRAALPATPSFDEAAHIRARYEKLMSIPINPASRSTNRRMPMSTNVLVGQANARAKREQDARIKAEEERDLWKQLYAEAIKQLEGNLHNTDQLYLKEYAERKKLERDNEDLRARLSEAERQRGDANTELGTAHRKKMQVSRWVAGISELTTKIQESLLREDEEQESD